MLLNFQLLFQSNEHNCDNTHKYAQFCVYCYWNSTTSVYIIFEYINTKKNKCFVLSNSNYNATEIKAIIKLFIST